mgnify:FL=1|jgi:hypothetical protein
MGKGVTLSKKHGLNPSITVCPICGKEIGIALLGKLKEDEEAPRKIIEDLCDDCISKLGNDKIYILAINDQGYGTKGIIIKRSALNIPVKGYMTLIKENEFDKVFKH